MQNGIKLYYPIVEMINSILPIVDEFIIAIGEGDEDDNTRQEQGTHKHKSCKD